MALLKIVKLGLKVNIKTKQCLGDLFLQYNKNGFIKIVMLEPCRNRVLGWNICCRLQKWMPQHLEQNWETWTWSWQITKWMILKGFSFCSHIELLWPNRISFTCCPIYTIKSCVILPFGEKKLNSMLKMISDKWLNKPTPFRKHRLTQRNVPRKFQPDVQLCVPNGNQRETCKRKHLFPVGLESDVHESELIAALASWNVTSATGSPHEG